MLRKHGLWIAVLVGLGFLTVQSLASAEDAPLPVGVKAVWDMSKAYRDTTPTDERICINGLWRWQPAAAEPAAVPDDNWGFFKVPGSWPGITSWIQGDSQEIIKHPSWQNVPTAGGLTSAWYQREITIPANWKGRRITLYTEYLNSYAAVYLDGKRVGQIYFPAGEVDITSVCKPGVKQLLSLCVRAVPQADVMLAFTNTTEPVQVKGSIERRGLCGDVYLVSTPAGPRVTNVTVNTSVRKWNITFHADLADLKADKKYSLKALVTDNGQKVKEFESVPFTAADLKDGRFSFTQDWKPTKLWDTNTPQNMYHVQVSLVDGSKPVEVFRPVRFGFREFWAQGRDFYLNGTPFHCAILGGDNALLGVGWSTYDAARESFLREKSFGINTLYTHNYGTSPGGHVGYEEILRAADDVGMLISFSMPHYGNYDWKAPDADQSNGYAHNAAFYARMAGNHPSVVFYSMNHNAFSYGGQNPDVIDGKHNEEGKIGPRVWQGGKNGLRVQAIVEKLDSSRIVYHHSSDSLGHAYTLNLYLAWTPIQEVNDWFEHWSKEGIQPLILCEFDTPYDFDWTMYRGWYEGKRPWSSGKITWEYCPAEWNSTLLGDRAFDLPDTDKVNLRIETAKWKSGQTWYMWDYKYGIVGDSTVGNKLKQESRALCITDNWRAFRTYGVSATNEFGMSPFWSLAPGASRARKDLAVDWDNIQKPGFSPDYDSGWRRMDMGFEKADWVPGPAAEALIRNNMPLLAYIAGKTEHFTAKDHNFLPGESFQKQLIIINDSRVMQDCDASWSLALPQPIAGTRKVSVKTGEQARIPLDLTLPADVKPGSYNLTMTAKFSQGELQTDTFQVNVLAPVPAIKAKPKTALFDPKGDTAKVLTDLGVQSEPVAANANLAAYDVLIIGKGALTPDGPAPDVSKVRDGLKVIMFEQTAPVLEKRFGFRVQEYGLRNAFARVSDHPILAGLTTQNLHDWRGQATLTPPRLENYVTNPQTGEISVKWCGILVSRSWRNGNWGNVSSVMIEKPVKGDFLPIVDGGFSLQYSPLMVYREGKGLVVLCQMDVSGRTESEPTTKRLVSNILDYVASYAPAPRRNVVYVGEDAGKTFLEQSGLTLTPYQGGKLTADQVLIVGPTGSQTLAANAEDVRAWVKAGGNVLALGLGQDEANSFLPFAIQTKKVEHISTVFAPTGMKSLLAGVGCADVMNRDPRQMDLIAGGATVLGNGVLATGTGANVVFSQMAPWQFDYAKYYNQKRTFRRTAYLVARALGNMNAGGSTPLLDRVSTPAKSAEPWLDSFYLDKPQEFDDPYRYFGW